MPEAGWQGSVGLSWSIYDGGYRYGLHKERAAQRVSAQAQLEAQQRQSLSEVRTAVDQLTAAQKAQAEAEKSADVAKEVLALATEAYQAGASTSLELIDAERNARDAEANALIARDGTEQARINLLVASGRFPEEAAD